MTLSGFFLGILEKQGHYYINYRLLMFKIDSRIIKLLEQNRVKFLGCGGGKFSFYLFSMMFYMEVIWGLYNLLCINGISIRICFRHLLLTDALSVFEG